MNIELGKTQVSMMNPPNSGTVIDGTHVWDIGRNGQGLIVLRDPATRCPHPEFYAGMDMSSFCWWINSQRQ